VDNLGGRNTLDNIKKIHIAHLGKLIDRGEYISEVLETPFFKNRTKLNISTEQKDALRLEKNSYNPNLESRINYHNFPPLKKQEICFQEQMLEIYSEIAESEEGIYLILEDDFRLCDGFLEKHEEVLSKIPEDSDCCFLGSCCNLRVPEKFTEEFFPNKSSRCGIAYTITPSFCRKILKIKEYYMPTDWNLKFVKDISGGKFYWSKTLLFVQGSEGIYKSNIR
jgi:GR25 family glycosyltransferase involved in LPS biosynthesis